MSIPQQIVEEAIETHEVVIFSKSYCPYCKKAKALLDSLKTKHHDIELDMIAEGAEIQQYLLEKTNQRTVPNIFIAKKHIGGSDDLIKAHHNGTIQNLLAESSR